MDVTPILENLNDAQREAVTAAARPTLVIAGAGSGKTRVLVHRAARDIEVRDRLVEKPRQHPHQLAGGNQKKKQQK